MRIRELTVRFGSFTAVDGVSFDIPDGGIVGLVGESGSGKSTVARALVGLVPVAAGTVEGTPPHARQLVFQDPYGSLNPRLRVRDCLAEALPRGAGGERAIAAQLEFVGLDPEIAERYPHELSGGQRQRVAIARAIAAQPRLLVADEITSALDVSVQGAVLNLVRDLRAELGLSVLFISHNLAVVRYVADSIAVMHRGRLVEFGPTEQLVTNPAHGYTRELLAAVPTLGERV